MFRFIYQDFASVSYTHLDVYKRQNRLIGKTEGIAHRDAVFSLCEALKGFLRQFMAFIENSMEGLFCLLINSCNRGTGQNIVLSLIHI